MSDRQTSFEFSDGICCMSLMPPISSRSGTYPRVSYEHSSPTRAGRSSTFVNKTFLTKLLMPSDVRLSSRNYADEIRLWRHGDMPVPNWIPPHIVGNIAANGTFEVATERGHVRVHPGHTVVERCGTVWVCPLDEAPALVKTLRQNDSPALNSVGPGKGRRSSPRAALKTGIESEGAVKPLQKPHYPAPVGCLPSIEWIQVNRLSIDRKCRFSTADCKHRCKI